MRVIAITGGVACGKSLVAKRLKDGMSCPFFSCDDSVAGLLERPTIQNQILELLESKGGGAREKFSRSLVRKHAFENSDFREKLEALLHPLVYRQIADFLGDRSSRSGFLLVEVPLLYEVDFPLQRDLDLVVAASRSTQMKRMTGDRGLDPEIATQILDAQLPIPEKIRRGDVVVWNDGSMEALNSQIEHLVRRCA